MATPSCGTNHHPHNNDNISTNFNQRCEEGEEILLSGRKVVLNKTRVRDQDGFVGTIRYIGPVASAKKKKNPPDVYAGIEWDDVSRGKHNGSVVCHETKRLVSHFSTNHPTSASFLRPHKIDWGTSITKELLQQKYVVMDAPLIAPNNIFPDAYVSTSSNDKKGKPIEFHGELQIRKHQQIDQLSRISLRNQGILGIHTVYPRNDNPLCAHDVQHLLELDLGGNLLSDWTIVCTDILRVLNNLQSLSLACNRLGNIFVVEDGETTKESFSYPSLQTLNLYRCDMTNMESIQRLDLWFPNLCDLCIASNQLLLSSSSSPSSMVGFHHLTMLDASCCGFTDWQKHVVVPWSGLPSLKTLHLQDNAFSGIPKQQQQQQQGTCFQTRLEHLSLSGLVDVESWKDLEGLEGLTALRALTLRKASPLTSTLGTAETRAHAIARYPTLTMMNHAVVSEKERTEAEKRYLHHVQHLLLMKRHDGDNNDDDNDETKSVDAWLNQVHPRYKALMGKYPQKKTATSSHGDASSFSSSYALNVCIIPMAPSSCSLEPIHRRLPSTLTVGRLKSMLQRIFELDYDLQRLDYRLNDSDAAFPTPLDDDHATLGYMGVMDGCEILVNEVDVATKQMEEEESQRQKEENWKQQENHIQRIQQFKENSNTSN